MAPPTTSRRIECNQKQKRRRPAGKKKIAGLGGAPFGRWQRPLSAYGTGQACGEGCKGTQTTWPHMAYLPSTIRPGCGFKPSVCSSQQTSQHRATAAVRGPPSSSRLVRSLGRFLKIFILFGFIFRQIAFRRLDAVRLSAREAGTHTLTHTQTQSAHLRN